MNFIEMKQKKKKRGDDICKSEKREQARDGCKRGGERQTHRNKGNREKDGNKTDESG
ncbi:hypothetical protein BCR43DRAFT_152206 [Syncephalastrum racemosum]|uniref:Uncharacterized protein n=1 Tax=Syncephalastrum racemosum TaxID=13706 RepID=A0A1X2HPE4_SYNRA|nr:hypothetical protein BCR43DRAFT_152206 [Syncephalastrum racemosum]